MSEKKYISARDGEKNSVIYKAADGAEFVHSGGSRAWRNNNPGNLAFSEKSDLKIGKGGRFAVFADEAAGMRALKYSLTRFYAELRLDAVFKKYAPSSDNNDPEHYFALVRKFTGLDSSRKLGDLNDAELDKFMKAIKRVEGWIVGKIEVVPHAQQFEVKAVDGKPMSGIDYLMSFFTKDGEEKKISGKTDEHGKTAIAKTNTKSPVTLTLPRPDPGQSLKNVGIKAKAGPVKKVVAAEVKAKPWYEQVFDSAFDSDDVKDTPASMPVPAPPASEKKSAAAKPLKAPVAVVKQAGAIEASATQIKAANFIAPVVKGEGVFITWQFDTTQGSQKNLNNLPYFIALMDGGTPVPLSAGQGIQMLKNQKIRQKVPFGKKVALFLGNDAKEQYRKTPLYCVTAQEGFTDIVVKIKETRGTGYSANQEIPHGDVVDGSKKIYTALLYGKTWFNFSHKFTAAEAAAASNSAAKSVKDALKKIYEGAATAGTTSILLSVEKPNGSALKIVWQRPAFQNCRDHIAEISSLAAAKDEIIPRVNPQTYKAFLEAAFDIDADEMEIASGWRPMLGSVLHRIRFGLDVAQIKVGNTVGEFRRNHTAAETEYRQLIQEKALLKKKAAPTEAETARLNQINAIEKSKADAATKSISSSHPANLRTFTSKLRANAQVKQTFDPWEMDLNARDAVGPLPNRLKPGNEALHKTHLHITVLDAELGHG